MKNRTVHPVRDLGFSNGVKIIFLALLLLAGIVLFACAHSKSMVRWHPVEVKEAPICSDCHTDARAVMDHTADFSKRHRFYALQQKQTCDLCHREAFCSDCHAHKEELKPSDKYKDRPELSLPHRGDYITQHKIDGRINPALCMKCHGRQNNERCIVCHR